MMEMEPTKGLFDQAPVENDSDEPLDPFSQENAPGLSLIVLMRIYDVVMAQYMATNRDKAIDLFNLHAEGKILGSLPSLDLE